MLLATIKQPVLPTSSSKRPRPVGMLGPLFLGQRNLVQEAGGWMYRDATGGNFMRNKYIAPEVSVEALLGVVGLCRHPVECSNESGCLLLTQPAVMHVCTCTAWLI